MPNATPVVLLPFIPRRSIIRTPLHVYKKRLRLYKFPFILRFRRLTGAQSARYRIMRKSHVQRLYQLKQCANIMEQSKNSLKQLDLMQLTFIDLAQQVHRIHAAVDYEIPEPPFDGYHYVWNWNGIVIRFCGSNYRFLVILIR
jgi:hypothetical protein